jgi:hypothetical protein
MGRVRQKIKKQKTGEEIPKKKQAQHILRVYKRIFTSQAY